MQGYKRVQAELHAQSAEQVIAPQEAGQGLHVGENTPRQDWSCLQNMADKNMNSKY